MSTEPGGFRAVAHAVAPAEAVRDGLDLLTEIAAPLRVWVSLGAGRLSMTTHGDEPWWATVTVPVSGGDGPEVSASVGRLDFHQAVDAEALLVPEATCSLTIVQDDVLRYGGFAFAAMNRRDPEPPPLGATGPEVEIAALVDGGYEMGDGRVLEVPASSVARFTARSISKAEVRVVETVPYLVGIEAGDNALTLVLVAQGSWRGGDRR